MSEQEQSDETLAEAAERLLERIRKTRDVLSGQERGRKLSSAATHVETALLYLEAAAR